MSEQNFAYAFLPFYRRGAAANLTDEALSGLRGGFSVNVRLSVSGAEHEPTPVSQSLEIDWPKDFVDLTHYVVRTDPHSQPGFGATQTLAASRFEPNYCPLVEFSRPDLPWLHTPVGAFSVDHADAQFQRLTPWLFLAVLKDDEFTWEPGGILNVTMPSALPNPADAWAWAHVHVVDLPDDDLTVNTPDSARALIERHPDLARARLLSPRRLEPSTHYTVFCLTTYEILRRISIGQSHADMDVGDQLIDVSASALRFRSHMRPFGFRTGVGGDFESLCAKLSGFKAGGDIGIRPVNMGEPGPMVRGVQRNGPADPDPVLGVQGALKSRETVPTSWPKKATDPFRHDVAALLNASQPRPPGPSSGDETHAPAANSTGEAGSGDEDDPFFLPPAFGRPHRPGHRFEDLGADDWYTQVNLDPRLRATANLGYRIVEEEGSNILGKAWEWGNPADTDVDLLDVLSDLRAAELSKLVGTRMTEKHLGGLSALRFLRATAGIMPRVLELGGSFAARLSARPDFASWLSVPARSLVRSRVIGRWTKHAAALPNASQFAQTAFSQIAQKVNQSSYSVPAIVPVGGMVTAKARIEAALTSAARGSVVELSFAPRASLNHRGEWGVGTMTFPRARPDDVAVNPMDFEQSIATALGEVAMAPVAVPAAEPLPIEELVRDLRAALDPVNAITDWIADAYHIEGGVGADTRLDRVLAYPEFATPVSALVAKLSKELLLPGVGKVPNDSVTLLTTNPEFVAAVHLGLNEAVARLLLFNRYPTDLRGSYFRRFWATHGEGAGVATASAALALTSGDSFDRDVKPHDLWTPEDSLADQQLRGDAGQAVLLFRGELLSRYPQTIIYAQPLNDEHEPQGKPEFPIFSGRLEPDITYVGFAISKEDIAQRKYYFVFEEPLGEPRFGLDATPPERVTSWADVAWQQTGDSSMLSVSDSFDLGVTPTLPKYFDANGKAVGPELTWATDAAAVAGILLQQPVRVRIHSAELFDA